MNNSFASDNNSSSLGPIHPDLLAANELAYQPSGLSYSNLSKEAESGDYGAFLFEMAGKRIKFLVAKITPTKVGQFVTLWKRSDKGPIAPHDIADPVDLYVISVRSLEHFGQFVFPAAVLLEKGILSKEGVGGKRAMRLYPPWDITSSRQASATQAWQRLYFFSMLHSSGETSAWSNKKPQEESSTEFSLVRRFFI